MIFAHCLPTTNEYQTIPIANIVIVAATTAIASTPIFYAPYVNNYILAPYNKYEIIKKAHIRVEEETNELI